MCDSCATAASMQSKKSSNVGWDGRLSRPPFLRHLPATEAAMLRIDSRSVCSWSANCKSLNAASQSAALLSRALAQSSRIRICQTAFCHSTPASRGNRPLMAAILQTLDTVHSL
jgi:hypothetical protein